MKYLSRIAPSTTGVQAFLLLLTVFVLPACEPGVLKEGLAPDDSQVVAVEVIPERPSLEAGETVLVHATALGVNGTSAPAEIDWTSTGGTLVSVNDSTARFFSASPGNFRIRGRHRRPPNPIDSTTVSVTPPPPVLQAVILTPSSASLQTGATQQFSVSGQWSNGATTAPAVTYTATGGSITQGGLYTAGSSAGTFRVIARQSGGTLADTATVTLSTAPPVLQAVVLTPSSASLTTGGTQQFSVSGQWSNGATTAPAVTYTATGGSITQGGLYTASSSAGTFRVIATQQGGTLADTSTVTLTAAPPVLQAVILTPSSASLQTGGTQQFSVSGQWSNGATTAPAVTYTATGGSITQGGLYTAGSSAGTFRVIATQQGGTLADTSAVTLTAAPPVLQAVILTPSSASLQTGAAQQFSVSGQWSNGATTAPAVTYSATGGSITQGGLYTAGSSAGTFRVIATQQGGGLADTSTVSLSTPPTGGAYPNRPSNFTNSRELTFSESVPATGPSGDRNIPGASWAVLYDGNPSNFTRVNDPTAPHSAPEIWQLRWPTGAFGGGVIGQGEGHGVGNIFTNSNLSGSPSAVYVSVWHKVDPNYQWHPISNKFLYLSPGQVLVQLYEGGKWLHGESLNAGQWLDPQSGPLNGAVLLTYKNDPITKGVWHHYEFVIDKAAGTFKIWMDGDLKTSAINVRFSESYFTQVNMTAYRGGGGETLTQELYWYYDHIFVAWP